MPHPLVATGTLHYYAASALFLLYGCLATPPLLPSLPLETSLLDTISASPERTGLQPFGQSAARAEKWTDIG